MPNRSSFQDLIDEADVLLFGIKACDTLRLTIQRTDKQIRNGANLECTSNILVLIDIDAIEVQLALIIMGDISQDRIQSTARDTPVGIEIDDHRTFVAHLPFPCVIVGNHLLELRLSHRVNGIDGIRVHFNLLSIDSHGHQCQQQESQYFLHCKLLTIIPKFTDVPYATSH